MLNKPYLRKIGVVGNFVVWEVDGMYIRKYLNEEFTNFGQHFVFRFIPKYEFWLDKEYSQGEKEYFIEHLQKEWELMNKGMSYCQALKVADDLEKKERAKSKLYQTIAQKPFNLKNLPKNIYLKKLKNYGHNLQIWLINGELVRDLCYEVYLKDGKVAHNGHIFTQGGHGYVYSVIPKNEIWLDNDLNPKEWEFVLLHELHERALMADKGLTYVQAHKSASALEYLCRHNPKLLKHKLKQEIRKNKKFIIETT